MDSNKLIEKYNCNNNDYFFVACAMKREAQLLINELDNYKEITVKGFKFFIGTLYNKKIIIGISGPGLINMSSMLSIALLKYDISAVINYGMAGGYGEHIHKGDIVIGKECMNINSYATGRLEKGIDINLWEFVTFIEDKENVLIIYNANVLLLESCKNNGYCSSNVVFGRIGSGDVWNKEFEKIKLLETKFNVCCEDMESVAIYSLCNRFDVPCISIKGVSNNETLYEIYDDSVLENLKDYVLKSIKTIFQVQASKPYTHSLSIREVKN